MILPLESFQSVISMSQITKFENFRTSSEVIINETQLCIESIDTYDRRIQRSLRDILTYRHQIFIERATIIQ